MREYIENSDAIFISIISLIEYLSYSDLTEDDIEVFDNFVEDANLLNLSWNDQDLIHEIVKLRRLKIVKLPDAIIAAQAITKNLTLVSRDTQFKKIPKLDLFIPT